MDEIKKFAVSDEKSEDILLAEAYELIQDEVSDIKGEVARELSLHNMESKKEVVNEREHYVEIVIGAVKKRLLGFCKTDAYVKYLENAIKTAYNNLGGLTRIYVSRNDLDIVKRMVKNIEVKQDLRIIVGGLVAENDGLTADFTFDKKLVNERAKLETRLSEL